MWGIEKKKKKHKDYVYTYIYTHIYTYANDFAESKCTIFLVSFDPNAITREPKSTFLIQKQKKRRRIKEKKNVNLHHQSFYLLPPTLATRMTTTPRAIRLGIILDNNGSR